MPSPLHIVWEKFDVNLGSRSEMILFSNPNQGTKCFRYSRATPVLSIVFLQGMNLAAFEHPWSTIVRMLSNPSDWGRSVIRSIDTYWNGPCLMCVLKGCKGAFI